MKLINTNDALLVIYKNKKLNGKYFYRWFVTGLIIGLFVSLFSIPINNYALFNLLGSITPGIDIWTNGTIHHHSAKAMWIYVTYSVPFLVYKIIANTKKVVILRPMYLTFVLPPFGYMFCSTLLTGRFFGVQEFVGVPGESSSLSWPLYSHTIVGANVIPLVLAIPCIVTCFVLTLFIIELLNLRQLWENKND